MIFTLRLAYGPTSAKFHHLNILEHFLDAVFLVEILFTFFIGIPLDEMSLHASTHLESKVTYNRNMNEIAVKYIKTTFITDVLSLIPKLSYWGTKWYLAKSLRIFHLF